MFLTKPKKQRARAWTGEELRPAFWASGPGERERELHIGRGGDRRSRDLVAVLAEWGTSRLCPERL